MERLFSRWTATALVSVVGVVLLAFYGTSQSPQELLLFQNVVKQFRQCKGPGCGGSKIPSGREWHRSMETLPVDPSKLESGSITWTKAAADAIIEEIERVQFPADCKATKWLATQQLSDDILFEYQNFLALLVFGASINYTVVPIHDSPMLPYATCRHKSLHCYFRPFTKCSLYSEPERLVQYGDAFYDYTHGRDFLHRDMGKVMRGDWGDRSLLLIPYGPHYPNERPYSETWLSALWQRLSASGDVAVTGGGTPAPEHVEAMVFSVVSDWMFKPVGRIEDEAADILAEQRGVKQPVLGVEMRTGYGGGPERFEGFGQVDVLAQDSKKMKRLMKDVRWAFKTGVDNAGHAWNSTFVVTDSDFLLEELLQKPDALGVASATNVLFDKLEADETDGVVRRGLRARDHAVGSAARRRSLRQRPVGGDQSGFRDGVDSTRSHRVRSRGATRVDGARKEQVHEFNAIRRWDRHSHKVDESPSSGELNKGSDQPSSHLHAATPSTPRSGLALLSRAAIDFAQTVLGTFRRSSLMTRDSHDLYSLTAESESAARRKLQQSNERAAANSTQPPQPALLTAGTQAELEEDALIGQPESGQDWSAVESRRRSEDRALANALILARLSDYAVLSLRSNVGRLAAQVISARKRVTQVGPLGPVVHSTLAGGLVNPLGASAGPGLPGGTLRWSNTVEKLVYEELDRTQFPEECGKAKWLVARLNNQGVALNFHSYQMALVLAMSLGRTLVVDPSDSNAPQPSDEGSCVLETLDTLFEPLSGCAYGTPEAGDEATLTWDDAMTSSEGAQKRVIRLETVVPSPSGFVDRGTAWVEPHWWEGFLENLIVAGNLRLEGGGDVRAAGFLDLHFMLWSITTQWMWAPRPRIREIAEAIKCAWPDRRGPTVAMHVRRTDRGWGDGYFREHHRFRDLDDYGRAVEKVETKWGISWPSVFLFTDTAAVLRQAAANISGFGFSDPSRQVMYNPLVELDPITVHQSHLNVPCQQRNQIMQHYVAEITVAAESADYAVFAGSASGARIVWELMGAHRQFAQTKAEGDLVHSLDTGWYYEW